MNRILTLIILLSVVFCGCLAVQPDNQAGFLSTEMSIVQVLDAEADDVAEQKLVNSTRPASQFTHPSQSTPIFAASGVLDSFLIRPRADGQFYTEPVPPYWYQIREGTGLRLSQWKDSNLLYTARITYHA